MGGRYFRAGVGAIVLDGNEQVLVLERSDIPGAWQLPQGGLEEGEDLQAAALRELSEETGIRADKVELIAQYPDPLVYVLPREVQKPKTDMGQVQFWFLFRLLGSAIDLELPKGGEFKAWSWQPIDRVVENAAPFRKPVYERLKAFLETKILNR